MTKTIKTAPFALPTLSAILLAALPASAEPGDYWSHAELGGLTEVAETSAAPDAAALAAEALETIAATDPSLELTHDAEGEVDGMIMLSDVLFDYAAADVREEAEATLAAVAAKLGTVGKLEVVGHTDSRGPHWYNDALGMDRAEAVRDWLVDGGYMAPEAVTAATAGEREPLVANATPDGADDPEARALNRRVEFRIVETEAALGASEAASESAADVAAEAAAYGPQPLPEAAVVVPAADELASAFVARPGYGPF